MIIYLIIFIIIILIFAYYNSTITEGYNPGTFVQLDASTPYFYTSDYQIFNPYIDHLGNGPTYIGKYPYYIAAFS